MTFWTGTHFVNDQRDMRVGQRAFLAEQERNRRYRQQREKARKERDPMKDRLKELGKKARAAVAAAASQEQSLYAHGRPLYDYGKHEELLREIKAKRNEILREVETEAREISAAGRRTVDLLQEFPRDSVLTSSERSELTDRLPLIRSEFEAASPQQIARRLESAHEYGSKVERFAAWAAAKERRRELEERGQEHAGLVFFQQFDAIDRGLFAEEFKRRAAGPAEIVNEAVSVAEFCFTRSRDAQSLATAHTAYSIDSHLEKQRYLNGGRPLEPSAVPNEDKTPAGQGGVAAG
jgi:hypothetical protein